jgi:HlyD family secretion protein
MRKFFTTRKTVVILVILVTAGVIAALRARSSDSEQVDLGQTVARQVFRSYVSASGEIVATRFADVGSSVMGRVVALNVREGDRVRRGQTLARIDAVQAESETAAALAQIDALEADRNGATKQVAVAQSDLDAAQARAAEAARARDRAEQLFAAQLLPAADRDAALADADAAAAQVRAATAALARAEQAQRAAAGRVAQARAQATRARDVFDKTNITSPIDGVVTRLQVREGEMVVVGIQNQPGTTLMTISDLSDIDAEVRVAEADVLRLAIGQPATVTLDAVSGATLPGRVVAIGASALPTQGAAAAAREFRVVIRLDAAPVALRPGLTCDAEILAEEKRDVVTAPLQSVVLRRRTAGDPEIPGVFVARDGRAIFTPVTTGIIGGLDVELAGVPAGTPVVTGPIALLRTLQDGAAIGTDEPD